ncbi:MAG: hypothetical protein IJP09_02525 [Clostridia bacterium]|nr:hypothetical protein [Clostridia bacterium]
MKKIFCLALIIALISAFAAETLAYNGSDFRIKTFTQNRQLRMVKKDIFQNPAYLIETPEEEYVEPNLIVVDSRQVSVKYELWIVKIFKDIFKLN